MIDPMKNPLDFASMQAVKRIDDRDCYKDCLEQVLLVIGSCLNEGSQDLTQAFEDLRTLVEDTLETSYEEVLQSKQG